MPDSENVRPWTRWLHPAAECGWFEKVATALSPAQGQRSRKHGSVSLFAPTALAPKKIPPPHKQKRHGFGFVFSRKAIPQARYKPYTDIRPFRGALCNFLSCAVAAVEKKSTPGTPRGLSSRYLLIRGWGRVGSGLSMHRGLGQGRPTRRRPSGCFFNPELLRIKLQINGFSFTIVFHLKNPLDRLYQTDPRIHT